MSDNKTEDREREEDDNRNVDRMDAGILGNHLKVSGPSISKLWPFVGWGIIIGISALSISHIIRTILVNWK